MKYLKYLLAIIALLFVIFILLGFIKPEVTYDAEIIVNKPLQESWQVTQDESKMPEWLPGFIKIEHIRGTPGTVGSVADVYFDNGGQEMSIRETITEIVPNESISMTYETDFMNMDYKMMMTDEAGNSKISSTTTAKGNSMIARSMMSIMGGTIKGQEEINLVNLKKTIENNTIDYFNKEKLEDSEVEID